MFIGMVSHSSWFQGLLVLPPSEGASFCKPCFSSCKLAEDSRAANTQNYCLCMAKDGGDFIASWAFHIHEIGIGALHQVLLLVFPLLLFWRGMKEILCKRHVLVGRSSRSERSSFIFNVVKIKAYKLVPVISFLFVYPKVINTDMGRDLYTIVFAGLFI